jgi:hypothetical protein
LAAPARGAGFFSTTGYKKSQFYNKARDGAQRRSPRALTQHKLHLAPRRRSHSHCWSCGVQ